MSGLFRYSTASPGTCNDTFGTRAPTMGGSPLGAGSSSVNFSQNITGLTANTTYYYCAIAMNSIDKQWGSVQTFITPSAPTATTTAATYITNTTAQINGSGNPNRTSAVGWFRYAISAPTKCDDVFGSRAPVTGSTSLGSDIYDQPYSQSLSGLSPATTYYYCAIVQSSEGTAFGTVLTFTTSTAATASTTAAGAITSTSATLNGAGNPNSASTYGWFRYANTSPGTCNDSFGTRVPSSSGTNLGAGNASVPFAYGIGSLSPATTYYYCAMATNSYGTGYGAVMSFTTPAMAPTVTTYYADKLTKTTATLYGYGTPGGDATTAWFRYSTASPGTCNDSFGTRAPTTGGTALGSGSGSVNFSQNITGLAPNTLYYFCAFATNSMGTAVGQVQTFTTPSSPTAVTTAATYLTTNSAQINGTGNPQRASAQGWFRYSTTAPMACNDTFGSRAPVTGSSSLGSDIYDQPFSQSLSGLSSSTTYYYCAIVQSSEGTAYGALLSFTTSGAPTATTVAASSITATSATLNGSGNPNNGSATGWFRYSNTNPGSCSDSFGTRAPSSSGVSLGSGSSNVAYAYPISGLVPGATYYFCAIAGNSYGTAFGAIMSFTTPATAPTVTTYYADKLTSTTGTLYGYGTPGGDATTAWFRYSTSSPGTCNDTFGTRAPTTGGTALGAGTGSVNFSQNITGLTANTTYYFCALATNSMGTVMGMVQTFITPSAPTAVTTAATYLTTNSAQLNGTGNPNRASAQGWFRYSTTAPMACNDTFGSRAPVTGSSSLGSDIYDQPFSQSISGLSSGTTYYYCAIVQSSEGTAFGALLSFTTSGIPTATTVAASSITSTSATLNGSGNPNNGSATGWFRYSNTNPGSCSDSFGTRVPSSSGVSLGSGSSNVSFSYPIGSLVPGATYYYCAIAGNTYGTGLGAIMSFTTPAQAPQVTTYYADKLTRTTGTLYGYGTPGGDATTAWFRFSTTSPGTCNDTFGTRAPAMTGGSALGAGTASVNFNQNITGLTANTTYYFCAIAENSIGKVYGQVQTFITPSAPTALTTAATYIGNNSAQLNGSGNPNRASAQGWFRYSTTAPMSCNDTFGSRAPVTGSSSLGADIYDQPFSQSLSGLSPATQYYYCAIVQSSEGTAFGAVLSFTTATAATATTVAATMLTSTSAQLNGSGNPNGASASGWFRYATTSPGTCNDSFGTRYPTSSSTNLGAGSANVPYYYGIGSLTPGATYYYCAIVSNTYGTGFGAVMSFTTPAQAPQVTTYYADKLTRTTGTLIGYANPGGDATTGWFRYSTASPGTCNDTFGTRAPAMTGGSALGSGTSTVTYQQNITGLTAGTMYYFCAIASNSQGTSWGTVSQFITPTAPTALTTAPTYITTTSAQLNGSGNPNRASAQGWFRYATTNPGMCNDTFGSRAPTSGGSSLGADVYDQPYSQSITGLSPATTYYYCAIVSSTEGTALGTVLSFTTAAPATATTTAATSVASTTATLNGSGNPQGAAATGWFRYSTTSPGTCNDTFGQRTPLSGGTNLGAGTANVSFGAALTGLTPGVTYYYCAIASNTYGTGLGALMSLTTTANAPAVNTDYTSGITTTLNASANPNGAATTGWFRIATTSPGTCNDTFGTRIPTSMGATLGGGSSYVAYSYPGGTLTPGTTYYYCAIAENGVGKSFGVIRSFTEPMPPSATTLAATPVTATTATLNGSGNPNGNSTIAWFRYSTSSPGTCNDVFGTRTPASGGSSLGSGTTATPFSESITGLAAATTYYFCAIASSAYGTSLGSVLSFTTPASIVKPGEPGGGGGSADAANPVKTEAATAIAESAAVFNGSVFASGKSATAWFRYDTVDPEKCDDKFGTRAPKEAGTELAGSDKAVEFSQTMTGLAPGQTYFFCALATFGDKTYVGAVRSLTTKATAPSVTTKAPTDVANGSALLNAAVIPNGAEATSWFRFGTTKPESCSDDFGARAPLENDRSLGAGAAAVGNAEAIYNLKSGVTYYYCAVATNSIGTSFGEVLSFVAGAATPSVVTDPASIVDANGATIGGTVSANGAETKVWFRYGTFDPGLCDDSFGSRAEVSIESPLGVEAGETVLGGDTNARALSATLRGLKPGLTYYFCAAASNAGGAKFGQVRSFATVEAPLPAFTTAANPAAVKTSIEATAAELSVANQSASAAGDTVESAESGGCSYAARQSRNSALLSLFAAAPLLALMLRRRRRAAA